MAITLHHVHPYLEPHTSGEIIAFAHRGGTHLLPENTLVAFRHAVTLGYRYLETDVQVTADGYLVAFHDNDLSRTCQVQSRIEDMTWQELSRVRVDGLEPIPLLSQLLEEFPNSYINIDAKSDACIPLLIEQLNRFGALRRVCIGSFSHRRLSKIRSALGPAVCTSATPIEVARWLTGLTPDEPSCFQVPVRQGPLRVVTERTVHRAHVAGRPIHVWTVDDQRQMQILLDLGVDGIMTDRSMVLKQKLIENNQWR